MEKTLAKMNGPKAGWMSNTAFRDFANPVYKMLAEMGYHILYSGGTQLPKSTLH